MSPIRFTTADFGRCTRRTIVLGGAFASARVTEPRVTTGLRHCGPGYSRISRAIQTGSPSQAEVIPDARRRPGNGVGNCRRVMNGGHRQHAFILESDLGFELSGDDVANLADGVHFRGAASSGIRAVIFTADWLLQRGLKAADIAPPIPTVPMTFGDSGRGASSAIAVFAPAIRRTTSMAASPAWLTVATMQPARGRWDSSQPRSLEIQTRERVTRS
jgi:hypothetical protein